MRSLWTLIKLYVNSIFRFSVMCRSKDARERRNAIMGVLAIALIVVVYGGMSASMSYAMLKAGIDASAPFLMFGAMASLFALVMAFAQGSATLSDFADFDTLMGMPIKTSTVVLARFAAMYLAEMVYSIAYVLPCGIVYAVLRRPVWWFYPVFPLMLVLLPVAPVVLGSGADLLLSAAFAKSKYRKGVTSTIKMLFLLAFIVFAYLLPQLSESFLAMPQQTAARIARVYPPAQWFADGLTGSFPLAALFLAGSIVLCALFVLVLNRTFLPLHDRLTAGYHVKNYRLGALKRSGATAALFTVERKRFFNSTAWVINTIFGSVLILVLGIAGAVLSGRLLPLFALAQMRVSAVAVLTGVLMFCATASPTTCSAISMEGKQLWIAKTLPVHAKYWLRAKLLMNLLLIGPALLFTTTLLAIFYGRALSASAIAALYLAPGAALLFTTVFGLFVNAKMPRFSWKTDAEVVKSGGAVGVMLLVGVVLIAATVIPMLLSGRIWVSLAVSAAVLAGTGAVYGYLMKNAEQIRANL